MIYIIMATMMEAEPFIAGLKLEKTDIAFFHTYKSDDYTLIVSGIGKMNAAMAATHVMDIYAPDKILNFGAAGSLGDDPLGTVFQVQSIVESDRPVMHQKKQRWYSPQTIKGFSGAVLATQDIPVLDIEERQRLASTANLIDMEGSAIAHVCKRFKVDCHLFKFVTDNIQSPDHSDIVKNIKEYRASFFEFCNTKVLGVFT